MILKKYIGKLLIILNIHLAMMIQIIIGMNIRKRI